MKCNRKYPYYTPSPASTRKKNMQIHRVSAEVSKNITNEPIDIHLKNKIFVPAKSNNVLFA